MEFVNSMSPIPREELEKWDILKSAPAIVGSEVRLAHVAVGGRTPDSLKRMWSPFCNSVTEDLKEIPITALIVTTKDRVFSKGSNSYGARGVGIANLFLEEEEWTEVTELSGKGVKEFVTVPTGQASSWFAITEKGELYSWGCNQKMNLGHRRTGVVDIPTKVKIKAGVNTLVGSDERIMCLHDDGSVTFWHCMTDFDLSEWRNRDMSEWSTDEDTSSESESDDASGNYSFDRLANGDSIDYDFKTFKLELKGAVRLAKDGNIVNVGIRRGEAKIWQEKTVRITHEGICALQYGIGYALSSEGWDLLNKIPKPLRTKTIEVASGGSSCILKSFKETCVLSSLAKTTNSGLLALPVPIPYNRSYQALDHLNSSAEASWLAISYKPEFQDEKMKIIYVPGINVFFVTTKRMNFMIGQFLDCPDQTWISYAIQEDSSILDLFSKEIPQITPWTIKATDFIERGVVHSFAMTHNQNQSTSSQSALNRILGAPLKAIQGLMPFKASKQFSSSSNIQSKAPASPSIWIVVKQKTTFQVRTIKIIEVQRSVIVKSGNPKLRKLLKPKAREMEFPSYATTLSAKTFLEYFHGRKPDFADLGKEDMLGVLKLGEEFSDPRVLVDFLEQCQSRRLIKTENIVALDNFARERKVEELSKMTKEFMAGLTGAQVHELYVKG